MMRRILGMILVVFLILPTLSLTAISQEINSYEEPFIQTSPEQQDRESFIEFLISQRFNLGYFPGLKTGKYFIRQLRPPVPIQASPGAITLYLFSFRNKKSRK